MTDKKSHESRRKLLKSIAAGSGAIVAGKSLPEEWKKPVVDSIMLPAHAQTSPAPSPAPETCSTINVTFSFTTTVIGNGAVGYDIYPAGGGGSIDGDGIGFFSNDVVNTTYSHTYAPGQYLVYAAVGGSPGTGSITGTGTVTCCTGDSETILNVDLTGDGVGQTGCALVTIGADGTCTVEPSNNCP
jgi:hypothetical protein